MATLILTLSPIFLMPISCKNALVALDQGLSSEMVRPEDLLVLTASYRVQPCCYFVSRPKL